MKTVRLLPHSAKLKELTRKHGAFWNVEGKANMPCFNGDES